ncbi:MAG: hypothetical protein AAF485_01550 [Chloroflexota bacterium]
MKNNTEQPLPLPDKTIPTAVMLIGTFEVAISLLGLIVLFLIGQFNAASITFLILILIYGAMGAGLWAIQEWARVSNIILHGIAIPYSLYTYLALENGPSTWQLMTQVIISIMIIWALTQPFMQHKFKTVVPKKKAN